MELPTTKARKSQILLAVILGFVLVNSLALCQQTSSPSAASNTAMHSTPSAIPCRMDNGRPCPKWLYKLIGPYPLPPGQEVPSLYFWTNRGLRAIHRHFTRHRSTTTP